jgi:hypothetical protein
VTLRLIVSIVLIEPQKSLTTKCGPLYHLEPILTISKHIFERRIAYLFAVTFTRLSVLAYYLRIFPPGLVSLRKCCYILIVLSLAQFVEVFTVLIVLCKDISKLWTDDWLDFRGSQCFSSAVYSYSAAIGDSVVDSMIFALPIPYVWRLSKLRLRQRLGLMLIFGLGFIVCVVALLQIPFIKRREGNTRYFGSAVNMLIAIQITFAIVAASLPDLRALVARNFPNFSPLHHRSLVTAGQAPDDRNQRGIAEAYDIGHDEEMAEGPRLAFEEKRASKKPDWMRSSIPASLMSTMITHNEITRLSSEEAPQWPQKPVRAAG